MATVKNYLSLIKFSHAIFALPFALIGLGLSIWTAILMSDIEQGEFVSSQFRLQVADGSWKYFLKLFLLVVSCMVFARSAAMAFNRWLDAKYDAMNPRTAVREIPAGVIRNERALWFVIINCILFIACTWFINRICFYLSPVALFVILFYSYTKRFTALCHLVLGLGLSLAPIGAYLAVTGEFHWLPILFSCIVFCWVAGFDIIYALQDEAFDKENKLHSIPAMLGKVNALNVSRVLHFLSFCFVLSAGYFGQFHFFYWIGAFFFGALLIYQHTLVKPNDLSKVNMAFFTTNGIASVVFAVFVLTDIGVQFYHFLNKIA
jgi:4-hydroxybenzoate polyprenyltransferase